MSLRVALMLMLANFSPVSRPPSMSRAGTGPLWSRAADILIARTLQPTLPDLRITQGVRGCKREIRRGDKSPNICHCRSGPLARIVTPVFQLCAVAAALAAFWARRVGVPSGKVKFGPADQSG